MLPAPSFDMIICIPLKPDNEGPRPSGRVTRQYRTLRLHSSLSLIVALQEYDASSDKDVLPFIDEYPLRILGQTPFSKILFYSWTYLDMEIEEIDIV